MTAPRDDDTRAEEPARKYKWRYGPVRLVGPWGAVLVGLIAVITHANGLNKSGSENTGLLFYIGLGLIALGVIMFFVYRWMAKRGI